MQESFKQTFDALALEDERHLVGMELRIATQRQQSTARPARAGSNGIGFSYAFCLMRTWLRALTTFATARSNSAPQHPLVDVLFVAFTQNEFDSLYKACINLATSGVRVRVLGTVELQLRDLPQDLFTSYPPEEPSASLVSAVVLLRRWRNLLSQARDLGLSGRNAGIFFNLARVAYQSCALGSIIFARMKPRVVVFAHDHGVGHRALRLTAEVFGILTAYVQHACVSQIFPILAFDLAFLDGRVAAGTYAECTLGRDNTYLAARNLAVATHLVGHQKTPRVTKRRNDCLSTIGIAVSSATDTSRLRALVEHLCSHSLNVQIRKHPQLPPAHCAELVSLRNELTRVYIADPAQTSLTDFLSSIDFLIAGNSSIHLEASLAGVCTGHCNIDYDHCQYDYYGFVKRGLAVRLSDLPTRDELLEAIARRDSPSRQAVIQDYSATFGTNWFQREPELLARKLAECIGLPLSARDALAKTDALHLEGRTPGWQF